MKKLSLIIALSLSTAAVAFAQQAVSGVVFEDTNANNIRDEGEAGIPSVEVSNGRTVVQTNSTGRYTLSVDDDDIIFVIKPSDYQLPVNSNYLPQFYYIHKPDGSPELEYDGVEPTGPLPESVNFPLIKDEPEDSFRMLVFGDPQPYTRQQVDYFDRDIVSEVAGVEGVAMGISLGDLVGDDLDLFAPYTESVARAGIPWFNVYGNHDMNFDASSDRYADETFERVFGPATYAFNHGQVHFIVLDDVVYPRTDGESGYIGGITEEQFAFIEHSLKYVPKDHLVVLAFHIPLIVPEGRNTFRIEDRERLFDLLRDYPHTLSISAHTHIQQFAFFGEKEGWMRDDPHIHYNVGTTSGDWWSGVPDERNIPPTLMRDGTPNGYAILSFRGNSFKWNYKAANYPDDYRMSIWGPNVVPQDSWHSAEMYVNYFLGSERTNVEYRLNSGNWRTMGRAGEADPHVTMLRQKWDLAETLLAGKRPSNPVASTHLWSTGVPNNLPVGEQTIEIRVTDMFGRQFFDTYTYEVVLPGGN
ncbi:MAG: calcineurin-like phosphoesterase family protein [Balneolaceae bacterium]|nr:calcineurin-like phosphoesterase family protein [Balneolaceae bacterium]